VKKFIALIICIGFGLQTAQPMGAFGSKRSRTRKAATKVKKAITRTATKAKKTAAKIATKAKKAIDKIAAPERAIPASTKKMTQEDATALLAKKIRTTRKELDEKKYPVLKGIRTKQASEFKELKEESKQRIDKANQKCEDKITKIERKNYSPKKEEKKRKKAEEEFAKKLAKIKAKLQKATTKLKKKQKNEFYKAWTKEITKSTIGRKTIKSIIKGMKKRDEKMLKFTEELEKLMDKVDEAKDKYNLTKRFCASLLCYC